MTNALSSRDFRIKLFDLMKSKGVVDNVKTHLRSRLIDELRGGIDDQLRFSSSSKPATLLVRAINGLIVDYFREQNYDYTISVFIPEANFHDYRTMTNDEILRLLNISTQSTFYQKIDGQTSSSLLMSMLTCISSWLPGSSQHSSCQTSTDLWSGSVAGSTLDEKLNNLDALYSNRRDDLVSMHNLSTEEKLLVFQRNIELRTKENLREQMEQFRENEVKKIREEERQKCQMELQSLRKELELLHKSKMETLNEKEMKISERFKAELENERRELFSQRQTFLEELKTMKLRETEIQRNLELRERSLTLEIDRVKRLEEDIRKREATVANVELRIDEQVQMKLNKLRFEIDQQFAERTKNLQLVEMRTQEEARRVSEERLLAEQAKSEVATLRKHYSEADSTIHRLQSEVKILQNENEILREKAKQVVDYQTVREENAVLRAQMNNTTSRSSHRQRHDSRSSSPPQVRVVGTDLKHLLDQRVVNDELIDLKTQIALLQSSNEPEPYLNGRFASNHGGDYLSRVLKSSSDVQLNQTRHSTSSNYNQFLEDAKLRMLELDREADRVEENFRDYQHRLINKSSSKSTIKPIELDYSSKRTTMPSVKLNAQINSNTNVNMPTSTSLQDLNSPTQKFHWTHDQRLTNLPENKTFSQSNDRIFEHPEVTIKPSTIDERAQRRAMMTTLPFNSSENGGGSVPNILEHPDIRTPVVMPSQHISSPSSTSSTTSSNGRKTLVRQQSADVYSTLTRTKSPIQQQQQQQIGPTNLRRNTTDNVDEDRSESSRSSSSSAAPPIKKGPIQIIREYSGTSSASDADRHVKHSEKNNGKSQSEEDDFW